VGNYTITLRLYDIYGKESHYVQNIEMLQNYAPTYRYSYTNNYTIYGLRYYELDLYEVFYDYNDEDLRFTHSSVGSTLNMWASYSSSTDIFYGTPANNLNYTEQYTLNAYDPYSTSYATAVLNITVVINVMPYFIGVPTQYIYCYEGILCQTDFSQWVVDAAGDTIRYDNTTSDITGT
jgi:hypothetical protein